MKNLLLILFLFFLVLYSCKDNPIDIEQNFTKINETTIIYRTNPDSLFGSPYSNCKELGRFINFNSSVFRIKINYKIEYVYGQISPSISIPVLHMNQPIARLWSEKYKKLDTLIKFEYGQYLDSSWIINLCCTSSIIWFDTIHINKINN